jgi:glycosyltransferase involved in cell wall biosynthesis
MKWAGYFFFMKFLEKFLLWLYKSKIVITVSNSTYDDLKKLGFKKIFIVKNGINRIHLNCNKNSQLTLTFLGRLRKTKNPEDAIKIFLKVKNFIKEAQMNVIGTGPLEETLRKRYKDIKNLKFLGYVSEEEKFLNLCKSHFLIVPSIREGWGIVVIEANELGVPVIGYNVKGLKDSIKDGINGFLVNNIEEAAEKIIKTWTDRNYYLKLSQQSKNYASKFDWKITRENFLQVLKQSQALKSANFEDEI